MRLRCLLQISFLSLHQELCSHLQASTFIRTSLLQLRSGFIVAFRTSPLLPCGGEYHPFRSPTFRVIGMCSPSPTQPISFHTSGKKQSKPTLPGRNYIRPPPPPPISGQKAVFRGGGGGVYSEAPRGRNLYAPPPFIHPPPLGGYFQA